MSGPSVSLIVVVHDMGREALRTLASLTPEYQGLAADSYEVIVMDNGSAEPLGEECVGSYGRNFHYRLIDGATPSPAPAVNLGVSIAKGGVVGVAIDGARILSPGILGLASRAFGAYADPIVATLGWHLGPDVQGRSVGQGYDAATEDALLRDIGWPNDGYRLFEIASLAVSSGGGWFLPIAESNCLFVRSETFRGLGGYDERFDLPGGGLVNHDFFARACELSGTELVTLFGEGTFHQLHGGVATEAAPRRHKKLWREYEAQYTRLRGRPYRWPSKPSHLLGGVSPSVLESIRLSAERALREVRSS